MELDVENSCLEGDSNALVLPSKRGSNKGKGKNQGREVARRTNNAKLSNSQKRKLKKLEEEKERAHLLSESIKALEKYKIPENAFSVLRSSRNISRDETLKEKRRMAVQFSKAGLEVPHGNQSFKMTDDVPSCVLGATSVFIDARLGIGENYHLQQRLMNREVPNKTSVSIATSTEPVNFEIVSKTGSTPAILAEGTSGGDFCSPVQENDEKSLPTLCDCDGRKSKSMGKQDKCSAVDMDDTSNLQDSSSQRTPVTPMVVPVFRPIEVEKKRRDLPTVMMEQEIMEVVNSEEHPTLIICGETGCGKTTQVPQFLFEAGFGLNQYAARRGIIGVTQPRRVAVLATAKRVAFELGLQLGKEVGFQVRYDKRIGESCSIKFMTDGILLREVQSDILLRRYSVIILDEAHERSLNTDILIGMLSRVIRLRRKKFEEQKGQSISPENMIFPLKLILMSATMRVEDFVSERRLFPKPPPVINISTRPFPVFKHFSKKTEIVDYIGEAYKKVLSIHKKLPPGGILVFVTGQREVEDLCKKLHKASTKTARGIIQKEVCDTSEMTSIGGISLKDINEAFEIQGNSTEQRSGILSSYNEDMPEFDEDESEVSYDSQEESDEEIVIDDGDNGASWQTNAAEKDGDVGGLLGEEGTLASLKVAFEALAGKTASHSNIEEKKVPLTVEDHSMQSNNGKGKSMEGDKGQSVGMLRVLPLYAMLPAVEQVKVFEEIKEGERLVVVATNVAETSLTIPGIKYVVDTGREKVKNYNLSSGMETYEIQWISKASAEQRAGRAGRTGPGHCYRLYSAAAYNNIFPDFSCPEICKVPVDSIVLVLKSMGINKVENFPFPTPPETTALVEAERCLKTLEALDSNGSLTPMGKAMAYYPMSPRHSRMLLTVIQIMRKENNHAIRPNLILGYAVAAAAALSHPSPFQSQHELTHVDGNGLEENEKYDSVCHEKILDKEEKLRKKKLKERVKASRARFSNPSSDALTVAYALQCFELCEGPRKFCYEYALHLKTMEEMSKLRKQLLQLVFQQNHNHGFEQAFSWSHGTLNDVEQAWRISSSKCPLLSHEEQILGQAICAGWADRVARKLEMQRKVNVVEYQACMVKDTVFLHRFSSLLNAAPEFLVYSELLHTKRSYMHGATRVEPEWLVEFAGSLCCFSNKEDQKLDYNCYADQVYCLVTPTFGPHLWPLGKQKMQIRNVDDRVKAFAWALLEGKVLPCLKSVREFLAAPPSMILDRQSSGQRRVGNLLLKLKTRIIDSRAMLKTVWKDNPTELYAEIADWFMKSFQKKFGALWSEMLVEAQLEPSKRQEPIPKRLKRDTRIE